ncbi:FAD-dependent oxidoreductase, partial [Thermodesulfobacteriota bacterium]
VSVPVLASNRINDPQIGEEILRNGQADMITMARGLLTDPDLIEKTKKGQSDLIYHCIACNQGCFDNIFSLKPATCLVNPRAGRERELKATPADKIKKILVIGGGPAGMKAACTAAERGHKVTLTEKSSVLGGQLLLNRRIPGREEIITAATDLAHNVRALDIEVILEKEADADLVKKLSPDAVVIATGARPVRLDIPGADGPNVFQAWDLLEGKRGVGKKVAIVGGNAVGLETAMFLANQGTLSPEALHFLMANRAESFDTLSELLDRGIKEVTVVEMTKKMGQDIGQSTRWTVKSELKRLGVRMITKAKATGITEEGLQIKTEEGSDLLPADSIVIAAGSESENSLVSQIEKIVEEVHIIGDAKGPRNALSAIEEGLRVGLII